MANKDILKTTFSIQKQTYMFLKTLVGWIADPATFQKTMIDLLSHLSFTKIYIDDILIHSSSLDEHINHLKTVCSILKDNCAEKSFQKSAFYKKEGSYLGHIISKDAIRADTTSIDKFVLLNIHTKKDLRKLLGLLNWFSSYVPNFSKKASMLYEKLKGAKPVDLNDHENVVVYDLMT